MRNVSIWELNDERADFSPFVRLFTYKGYKGTLNEFLYPDFIHREDHIVPRDRNTLGIVMPCKLFQKGMTVISGYDSLESLEKGKGVPMLVFNTFEQAVNWLVRNGYDYYGEESSHTRRRKAKVVDFDAENRKYQAMAREYEKNLPKPVTVVDNKYVAEAPRHAVNIVPATKDASLGEIEESLNRKYVEPPVVPTPPASRVLNDQGAPVKQKVKKPTFMDNMMKFLRLFKK